VLQPLQYIVRDFNVVSELCPREAVALQTSIHKVVTESKSVFTLIGQCSAERSRLYKEQLKSMREISNVSTRNALQVKPHHQSIVC
jgi:hypothetical protein